MGDAKPSFPEDVIISTAPLFLSTTVAASPWAKSKTLLLSMAKS